MNKNITDKEINRDFLEEEEPHYRAGKEDASLDKLEIVSIQFLICVSLLP